MLSCDRLPFLPNALHFQEPPGGSAPLSRMQVFICPRDWTFATGRFIPDHMVSLQDPGADISGLRPPWVAPENHHVEHFHDMDWPGDPLAPSREAVGRLVGWLARCCGPGSAPKLLIHCDAGLGRSTATGYLAWSLFLGPGREAEAFEAMKESCLETRIIPNSVIVAHADDILGRQGALWEPLTRWNHAVPWRRTFR